MTTDLLDIPLKTITGEDSSLAVYSGKVLLIANVASKCGLTPQYEALETLYEHYGPRGLVVLGFPANDFAGQEPGSDAEIQTFCQTTFNVTFPMFAKIAVTGPARHPLYSALTAACPTALVKPGTDFRAVLRGHQITPTTPPDVLWNFEKFLIGRAGQVVGRFSPDIAPDDALIIDAIETALNS